ncbi:hypothetical protein DE146DRAFT_646123 [Phaeosphaeria sp. MPI-PUGE-AT-0046c]|nr:hypothetical protein DE146DRAFT_646123 [Phaeosphaeria sp. MPI-PUGE-AT-0046c]
MSAQTIQQLESARTLALGDGRYYPTIIPGVLPIIGYNADNQSVDVQRWGADFLAEAFASPAWPSDAKEASASSVLATLKDYLENVEDKSVTKSAVQAAASVYPLVYRHIVSNPNDANDWQLMSSIKATILRRMDKATPGVRICCVKFLQQVVLVQTPGIVDPRRPDGSDISLALVPRDHPVLSYASLEAEGHGLLDRLLDIIHGDHSDGLVITATLNTLGMLMQRRPIAANKILTSVFNFNPVKLANSPITPKNKVIMKSIERTTRALLVNVMKRNPENQINGRIQQFLERMHRMRVEVFDESNRKRPAPSEPSDGLDPAKRQRVVVQTAPNTQSIPPLPAGDVSWRQLYTLNPEGSTVNFDVQAFKDPEQLLRIVVPVLQSVDAQKLDHAINIVRSRYLSLSQAAAKRPPQSAPAPAAEDEEEYEPDFDPEDAEQATNRLDNLPSTNFPHSGAPTALAPYKLPEAPPLSEQEVQKYGDQTVYRAFGMLSSVDESQKTKVTKSGFNRLAATDYGRDAWVTILSRLATRTNAGLEDPDDGVKDEFAVKSAKSSLPVGEAVRDGLFNYIIHDWKKRIDVAISWLNEEWYNDKILAESSERSPKNGTNGHAASSAGKAQGNYQRCALRMFDGILGFIEHTDKILLRFLSEIPALDREILSRVKIMARDPERIDLACSALQYLYMFRPPVRTIVVDTLAEMWQENDRAKPSARKLLLRWRPEVLGEERSATTNVKMEVDGQLGKESANGALEVKAAS